ncbi:MAG: hypothetical protein JST17_15415 [Bacteroidetes bacterium]|nr:hypothetical protein [Bacteroidota bacterium]MBS1930573.1 hypothetical protein [Bacteroidota bacterium]
MQRYKHINQYCGRSSLQFTFLPCILLLLFQLMFVPCFAQKNTTKEKAPVQKHVYLLAKAYEDSIVLRWAPEDAGVWNVCKQSGYLISRVDYTNPKMPETIQLTPQPLKPMTLQEMKSHFDPNDKYAAITAQALYGKNFTMTKNAATAFADKIKQAHDALSFRFLFAMEAADFSAPVAEAQAMRLVDKNVKKGSSYIYIITVPGTNGFYKIDSSAIFITNKVRNIPSPAGLKAYGFDHRVELHWNRRQTGGFGAYNIERSDDNGKTFHILNKIPYYSSEDQSANSKKDTARAKVASLLRDYQVFFDSIPDNYKTYYYRIQGYDAFGELSPYSKSIYTEGIDLTAPAPPIIDSVKNITDNQLKISWTQKQVSPDLAGYYVSRSNNVKGPFYPITSQILNKNTRSFIDSAALPHTPNYYVIIAMDTAKNLSSSAEYAGYVTDSLPPASPTNISGTVDSSGIVHLRWKKNTEPDLKGYKVYYSYNPNSEFSQVTHDVLTENSFTDSITMNTLDNVIYYKVVAVDESNNHSDYSYPVSLKKPIKITPSPPIAGVIVTKVDRAEIEWIKSQSKGVTGYEVFRKEEGKEWVSVGKLNQDITGSSIYFIDSTLHPNTDYYYAAETIGADGLRSAKSFAVHVRCSNSFSLSPPTNFSAVYDKESKIIKLTWQYTDTGNYFFVIYYSVNNNSLEAWQSFEKGNTSATANNLKQGTYHFAIKVIHRDKNAESGFSKMIEMQVN